MPTALTHEIYVERLAAITKTIRCLGEYSGSKVKLKHECLVCENVWSVLPDSLLHMRTGCRSCSSKQVGKQARGRSKSGLTDSTYKKLLRKKFKGSVECLGTFSTVVRRIAHRCLVCATEWKPEPRHMITGTGCCPSCAVERNHEITFKRWKTIKVGDKKIKLQGYEVFAVRMLQKMGVNLSKMLFKLGEGKPTVKYQFEGKAHQYLPDMFFSPKNRIIEVKSIWTLGLGKQSVAVFKRNCAKARACVKQGFEFTLMVFDKKGNRIAFPKQWYECTRNELQELVQI